MPTDKTARIELRLLPTEKEELLKKAAASHKTVSQYVISLLPVSKFLKRKSAYRAKEAKANTFFEDMGSVSKAVKNNSCQIVMPITKRDC